MLTDRQWREHLSFLQMNEKEYSAWCSKHGFRTTKKKSKNELLKEKEQKRKDWAEVKDKKEIVAEKLEDTALKLKLIELAKSVNRKKDEVLAELEQINKKQLIFARSGVSYNHGLHEVAVMHCLKNKVFWIKDLLSWDCVNTNPDKVINNLIHHLFYKFRASPFWVKAFYEGEQEAKWAIAVAQGTSLKKLEGFPFKVSHKDALAFERHLEPEFKFKAGIVYALVMSWSESYHIAKAASDSQLSENYFNEETKVFWEQFFNLFKYQMFDQRRVREIIDYLFAQRFGDHPLNPAFSLKGKTLASLYRAAMEWHEVERQNRVWKGRQNRNFIRRFDDWTLDLSTPKEKQEWMIGQLTTDKELYNEGDAMSHCVFTYSDSCVQGYCTIHSLRKNGERVATIELRGKQLAQAKLKHNGLLKAEERLVLEEWLKKEKISFDNTRW